MEQSPCQGRGGEKKFLGIPQTPARNLGSLHPLIK